ncbi:MAG: O-antigen ligase family protein [Methylobacter sp.]
MVSYSVIGEKSLTLCRWLAIATAIAAPMSTAVASVASTAMVATWLISGNVVSSLKIAARQPAGKMLLLFLWWLLIGTFDAATDWADKIETLLSWKKLAFTFVLLGLFYEEHWKRLFIKSYLSVMVVSALVAVPLWLADLMVREGREPGIFMTNYSTQSMAFIAATICCVFLLKESLSVRQKYWLIAAVVLFLFNIFFISNARSGYVALPIAMVFALSCLYGFKKLPRILGAAGILLAVVVLTSTTLQQRIQKGLTEKSSYQTSEQPTSIGIRMVLAKSSIALIKERPMFGYGTSSFKTTYGSYVATRYADWRAEPISDPHNQYLFVWLENGLFGLVLFLSYIVTAIRQGLRQPLYGAMAASFLVAVCASSLFNSHFKTFPEGNLLAFFVGILLAQQMAATQQSRNA